MNSSDITAKSFDCTKQPRRYELESPDEEDEDVSPSLLTATSPLGGGGGGVPWTEGRTGEGGWRRRRTTLCTCCW